MPRTVIKTFILLFILLAAVHPAHAQAEEIVYSSCRGKGWNLWILNVETGENTQLTSSADFEAVDPRWFAGGEQVIFVDNHGRLGIVEKTSGRISMLPLPKGRYNQPQFWPGAEDRLIFSSLISIPSDQADIEMVSYSGGNVSSVAKLVEREGMEGFATISPDGRQLAYSYWPGDKPRSDFYGITEEIWIRDLQDGSDEQLTDLGADSFGAAWSPDGGMLAFSSNKLGHYDIWIHDFMTGLNKTLTSRKSRDSHPVWSPDGGKIFFVSSSSGKPQIYSFEIKTGTLAQISDDPCGVRNFDMLAPKQDEKKHPGKKKSK